MNEPLKSSQQEAFAQLIASDPKMTQADAYRQAYDTSNMADNSIHVNASKLMNDAKVALRVKYLKDQLAQKQLWTREMSVKALVKAFRVAEDERQSTAMTAAVKELNAMHGFNAPKALDLTSGGDKIAPTHIIITSDDDDGQD